MGTPDVGKRLLVEDIEVRDGEGKGAIRGRKRDGCQLTCCTCMKRKGKGNKSVHQGVRICLFRTRPDAITWRKMPHLTLSDNVPKVTNRKVIDGITLAGKALKIL